MAIQFNPNVQSNAPTPQFEGVKDQVENLHGSLAEVSEMARAEAMSVDKEIAHMTEVLKDSFGKKNVGESADKKEIQGKKGDEMIQMIDALLASLDTDRRARKKKTPLEQKLDELAALEGLLDTSMLPEEDKKMLEEFFSNMSRIKQLKTKLRQLEEQEDLAEAQTKREKEKFLKRNPKERENKKQKEEELLEPENPFKDTE